MLPLPKYILFAGFVLYLTACGKRGTYSIQGLDSMTPDQRSVVLSAVEELNSQAGFSLLSTASEGYPLIITFSVLPQGKLGFAEISAQSCRIELKPELSDQIDLAKAVIMHEFGHCVSGNQHQAEAGKIMSAVTYPFSNYSAEEVSEFVSMLANSIKIH